MEIFMHNLPILAQADEIKLFLAGLIHGRDFGNVQTNFAVHLHRPKARSRSGTGTFTLANGSVARQFLEKYGSSGAYFYGRSVYFKPSDRPLRQEVVEVVSRTPWVNPTEERAQREKEGLLGTSAVSVSAVQFGWSCRDGVYSIETEAIQKDARLSFNFQRREMHVVMQYDALHRDIIAVRHTSLNAMSQHFSTFDAKYVILLDLWMPPTLLRRDLSASETQPTWTRMSTFPLLDNPHALPFTSLVLRIVFTSKADSDSFSRLAEVAGWRHIQSDEVVIERRSLFSVEKLNLLEWNLCRFNWSVAFQLTALLQNMVLDTAELLELLPRVKELVRVKGRVYTAKLLREFRNHASAQWFSDDSAKPIMSSFEAREREFAKQANTPTLVPEDGSYYQSLHVIITPTTMTLQGPYPEQSNRVLRRYDSRNHESFLRVTFRDDNELQLRFDREIDGPGFIKDRVGRFLKEGLSIAGRNFAFLAYSQSALKDHSVWFVKKFQNPPFGDVDARTIIESLGTFDNLSYDPNLTRCPARYAARISQAFTATDAAVVPVEEVLNLEDIKTSDGKYVFTDGVGTMSQDLARAIWGKLRAAKRKSGKSSDYPHAYQVRFRGSKGMLSIDHTLNGGHTIALRPSMIKFETDNRPGEQEVEIARAFDRPTAYYLNRPLITLLEGLGVPTGVFLQFQNDAVQETKGATLTLSKAARLLETHGLGASFRLPSTMLSLTKLGLNSIHDDPFYNKFLQIAVYHVLRDLKHHARIPIPDAWTLVGIADVHGYLQEGEIFACVKHPTRGIIFLEGLVVVSRSPTIHPGDVQVVMAIGIPPEGSCFAREPLYNTVVFSVKGNRPLPSCLGGGDLDGDIYNLIPLNERPEFVPRKNTYPPAEYAPTQRKLLDRPSTMEDVADFVMEYIISDVVGIIAINWLIIADQSGAGIEDEACLKLAQLHSDAVDYPKSGRAVDPSIIPKLKFPMKPDWNAPETINPDSANYYQSSKAVGILFRAVKLDDIPIAGRSRRRRQRQPGRVETLTGDLSSFRLQDPESAVFDLVEKRVKRFLDTEGPWEPSAIGDVARLFERFSGEFKGIAVNLSLSHRNIMLSEEEVLVGTITQKTSQPRARKEQMTKVREATDTLVKAIRVELEGDENRTLEDYLKYAWLAWELSFVEAKKQKFGAKSFGWLALGGVFDAMKLIEEHDASELRSLRSRRG